MNIFLDSPYVCNSKIKCLIMKPTCYQISYLCILSHTDADKILIKFFLEVNFIFITNDIKKSQNFLDYG